MYWGEDHVENACMHASPLSFAVGGDVWWRELATRLSVQMQMSRYATVDSLDVR
jgi:hypothetical protein